MPIDRRLGRRDELVLFVPGAEVSAFAAAFPERVSRAVEQSGAFAVEEHLAAPAQDIHAVIGSKIDARRRWVWCTSKARLEDWIAHAQSTGAGRYRIVPDLSLIGPGDRPVRLDGVTLAFQNERPIAIEAGWPEDIQRLLIEPEVIETVPRDAMAWLIERAESNDALVDLARDVSRNQTNPPSLKAASELLAVMGALLLLLIGQTALEKRAQLRAIAALQADAADGMVLDSAEAVSATFRQLSSGLIQVVQTQQGVHIKSLTYSSEPQARLRAVLTHPDFKSDETVRAQLQDRGFLINGVETTSEESHIISEITIGVEP
jgi:hypothetical protein